MIRILHQVSIGGLGMLSCGTQYVKASRMPSMVQLEIVEVDFNGLPKYGVSPLHKGQSFVGLSRCHDVVHSVDAGPVFKVMTKPGPPFISDELLRRSKHSNPTTLQLAAVG